MHRPVVDPSLAAGAFANVQWVQVLLELHALQQSPAVARPTCTGCDGQSNVVFRSHDAFVPQLKVALLLSSVRVSAHVASQAALLGAPLKPGGGAS